MSMDALAEELRRFADALDDFTEVLKTTEQQRKEAVERAAGLWDDSFRREFDRVHAEYAGPVAQFTESQSEIYQGFIETKLHQVRRYLDE